MMDKMDDPVIIGFDSCQKEGAKIGLKMGTDDWAMEVTEYAARENDFLASQSFENS